MPRFEIVATHRPVALVQPGTTLPAAPYAAVERDLVGPGRVSLGSGDDALVATYDGRGVALEVRHGGHASSYRSRRHGRTRRADALALTLTGPVVTAWTREDGAWVARALVDLEVTVPGLDVHAPGWSAALVADGERSGTVGQLGLRDPRLVTHADGTAYDDPDGDGALLLTATSAGPGGFRTGHTSVWSLSPDGRGLRHRADLFTRRAGGVYGDHASHLLRAPDDAGWLLATSTWGDFDRRRRPHVEAVLARSAVDLTRGAHVLDTAPLALPTDGLACVGVWDPHLVHTADGWLAAYVSATRFFSFHPVVAAGPDLDRLERRAAAVDRTATEGPTLVPSRLAGRLAGPLAGRLAGGAGEGWLLAASDGRDSRRDRRATYPILDPGHPGLAQVGTLDAAYPSNIPWPTLVPTLVPTTAGADAGVLLVGFDGTTTGGDLLGYGTHGSLVVQHTRLEVPRDA